MQLVGAYLVFSSLIVPALAAGGSPANARLRAACVIGSIGYALGVVDMPTGMAIIYALIAVA